MTTRFSKRLVLIGIILLYFGLVAFLEVAALRSEWLTRTGYGYPLIYGNGPYSTYGRGVDTNGALQPLPTVGGKSYDVVYHHYTFWLGMEMGLPVSDEYYLVPQRAIETLSQPPCKVGSRSPAFITATPCIDLRSIPGTSRVATVRHPAIAIAEVAGGVIIPAGIVLWVWRKYCR